MKEKHEQKQTPDLWFSGGNWAATKFTPPGAKNIKVCNTYRYSWILYVVDGGISWKSLQSWETLQNKTHFNILDNTELQDVVFPCWSLKAASLWSNEIFPCDFGILQKIISTFLILTRLVQQDNLLLTPLYDFRSKKLTLGYKGTTARSHDFTSPPLS